MKFTMFLVLLIHFKAVSQNMVPNPSFEEINDTITKFVRNNLEFSNKIEIWTSPNTASPDLITPDFNEKFISPSQPHFGDNMIGIQVSKHRWEDKSWSEYIGVKLIQDMIPNKTYLVEYWIRRSECITPSKNKDEYLNNDFGVLLASDPINTSNPNLLPYNPQITTGDQTLITSEEWKKISKYITPTQHYSYLYLGQFQPKDKNSTILNGYYLIDDVSITELIDFDYLDKTVDIKVGSKIPLKNVQFKTGEAELTNSESFIVLEKLTIYLQENTKIRIRVNGHTDCRGNNDANKVLSERRAKVVFNMLIQNGINKDRIEWLGYGEEMPIEDNATEEGREINRRVEFEIIE